MMNRAMIPAIPAAKNLAVFLLFCSLAAFIAFTAFALAAAAATAAVALALAMIEDVKERGRELFLWLLEGRGLGDLKFLHFLRS